MDKKEYIALVKAQELNEERISTISRVYNVAIDEILGKVVSLADTVDFFDEERRALSFNEIENPIKTLNFDFASEKIIPVIDAYDMTYIVYITDEKKWAKFSVVDKTIYKKKDNLEEVV